jgi:PST family polysaccharide transporter
MGSVVAFPVFGGLAAVAPVLVPVAFGEGWTPSIAVMQWLALAGLVQCLTYFDRPLLLAVGRPRLELGVTTVATIGNLIAFAVSVPFGIAAVAAAYGIRNVTFWPVRLWALRSVGIPLGQYGRALVPAAVASLACSAAAAGVVYATDLPDLARLVVAVVAGGVAYVAVLWLTAPDVVRQVHGWVKG